MCQACVNIEITSAFTGLNDLIKKVFEGILKRGDVDESLFLATGQRLWEGVKKGYNKPLIDIDYDSPDGKLIQHLHNNVYVFSGFKTYQELRAMTDLLLDSNGKPKTFPQFKKEVLNVHADYDIRFLNAEYNHAIGGSLMGSRWIDIEKNKKLFPLLKYVTAHDERVRDSHRILDGIILPVDHPFWNTHYPPLGWGCRCDVVQADRGRITPDNKIMYPDIPPMFRNNIGKTGVLFPESHPYFHVMKDDQEKAKNMFGLTIPKLEI